MFLFKTAVSVLLSAMAVRMRSPWWPGHAAVKVTKVSDPNANQPGG